MIMIEDIVLHDHSTVEPQEAAAMVIIGRPHLCASFPVTTEPYSMSTGFYKVV